MTEVLVDGTKLIKPSPYEKKLLWEVERGTKFKCPNCDSVFKLTKDDKIRSEVALEFLFFCPICDKCNWFRWSFSKHQEQAIRICEYAGLAIALTVISLVVYGW